MEDYFSPNITNKPQPAEEKRNALCRSGSDADACINGSDCTGCNSGSSVTNCVQG